MYGIIKDGIFSYAPVNFQKPDGGYITNFNKSEKFMIKYGYKPVIDNPPTYDENIEYLNIAEYTEDENNIYIVYEVCKIPVEEALTIEELAIKIDNVQSQVNDMEDALNIALGLGEE
nr:MAG TPA: hypothetical protein [Caudoviricetes sp.]